MDTPAAPALNKADQKVVAELARANIAEIEAARLALARSHNPQVKAYAQQMIDDHTKALNDIRRLAQDKGVNVPGNADARHKAQAKTLGKLQGASFDKAYMSQAGVRDHTRVHEALEKHHARVKDQDLKAFIAKMLPTVEQHLHHATQMQGGAATAAK
jgi:putative membrane protein